MKTTKDKLFCGRGGFTLVELLVVIVIIGLLVGILVPTINRARVDAMRNKSRMTVNAIEVACRMYKGDMGEFPPRYAGFAYEWLVEALVGYLDGDGQVGNGFRIGPPGVQRGQVYGPYNDADRLPIAAGKTNGYFCFIDSFKNPILYYCYDRTANKYNSADNPPGTGYQFPSDADYAARKVAGGAYWRTDFILMSAGPTGTFTAYLDNSRTDMVTNFLPE